MQQGEMIAPVGIGVASDVGILSSKSGYLVQLTPGVLFGTTITICSFRCDEPRRCIVSTFFGGKHRLWNSSEFLTCAMLMFIPYLGRCKIILDRWVGHPSMTGEATTRSGHVTWFKKLFFFWFWVWFFVCWELNAYPFGVLTWRLRNSSCQNVSNTLSWRNSGWPGAVKSCEILP